MTSEEMAKALGYTRVTVSRWENEGPPAKTDRTLRLYASAVRGISIDFESLFSTVNAKPERNFRIVVDVSKTVLQYSVDALTLASGFAVTKTSVQETLATFTGAVTVTVEATQVANQETHAANQELAQAA
jgi:DNA-binding XRE family transcriptional regulator